MIINNLRPFLMSKNFDLLKRDSKNYNIGIYRINFYGFLKNICLQTILKNNAMEVVLKHLFTYEMTVCDILSVVLNLLKMK